MASNGDKQYVQSLQRGLYAFEMVLKGDLKAADLAKELGIDRSSAYRMLCTLEHEGYVTFDDHAKVFKADPSKLLYFSSFAEKFVDWLPVCQDALAELMRKTSENSNLAIPNGDHVVYISQEKVPDIVQISNLPGTIRPLYCSALGKSILAFKKREEIISYTDRVEMEAMTDRTITNKESFLAELSQVYQKGYAIDNEEFVNGICCIASPIFDSRGKSIASMGVTCLSSSCGKERLAELCSIVFNVAGQTSSKLGYYGYPFNIIK